MDLLQPLVDGVNDDRRQPERELVGDQQAGGDDQHLGQRQHALLTARQRSRSLLSPFLEDGNAS